MVYGKTTREYSTDIYSQFVFYYVCKVNIKNNLQKKNEQWHIKTDYNWILHWLGIVSQMIIPTHNNPKIRSKLLLKYVEKQFLNLQFELVETTKLVFMFFLFRSEYFLFANLSLWCLINDKEIVYRRAPKTSSFQMSFRFWRVDSAAPLNAN